MIILLQMIMITTMMMKFKADFISKLSEFGSCLRRVVNIYGSCTIFRPVVGGKNPNPVLHDLFSLTILP